MPSIFHLPILKKAYQRVLILGSGKAVSIIGGYLMWLVLTMVLATEYGAEFAGWFFGIGNLLGVVLVIPLAGYLADRISSLFVMKLQVGFFLLGGLIRLVGETGIITYLLVGLCMFIAYGLVIGSAYLLKTTEAKDGGAVFGLYASMLAMGSLISALIYPLFKEVIYPTVPLLLIASQLVFLYALFRLPEDKKIRTEKVIFSQAYKAFFQVIKEAGHFIKTNKYIPLLAVGDAVFEGVFFGAIWFLLPLEVAYQTQGGIIDGLGLGIYEIVTIFTAGTIGYLADRYNWKYLSYLGWVLILTGVVAMYFRHSALGLIVIGALVGLGNNLEYGSAYHALEKYDLDHGEDGAFGSFLSLIKTTRYFIVPIVMGMVYSSYGLSGSLGVLAVLVGLIAVVMIVFSQRLDMHELEV